MFKTAPYLSALGALCLLVAPVAAGCDSKPKKQAPKKVGPAPEAKRPAPAKPAQPAKPATTAANGAAATKAPEGRPATVTTTPTADTPPEATGDKPAAGAAGTTTTAKPAPAAKPGKAAPKIDKMTPPPAPGQPIPAPADVAAPPAEAQKTASGLAYLVQRKGTGTEKPTAQSSVEVHYTGWTTDGKMFDSSVARGETISFPLNRVIPGWTEGVQLMVVGELTRFWIPEKLAYGGRPGAPAGMLVFDVELKKITSPPKAPKDVAAPPADAQKTASGLAYKVLKKGTGTTKPVATSVVEVHYTGWTTDGKMFDSSVMRGKPTQFPLNRVIPGWTEGVALMVEGEKTLFWIPEKLAYAGRPGAPQGMLVFEVELLKILK